ncbi:V-type ATP synthase subunit B, partial [Candidatus Bathyarchaeota archaeon]
MKKAGIIYKTVNEIRGPLLVVEGVKNARYNELVEVTLPDGHVIIGSVLDSHEDKAIIQVFGRTEGLELNVSVHFTGEVVKIPLTNDLIGRVFDGSFKPLDKLPPPIGDEEREVFFSVINPAAREPPSEFIQTGISVIDGMNSLVRGQKLPFFSEAGLPHNMIAAQVARQATIPGREEDFAIVFIGMGIKNEEYAYFRKEFEETGALNRSVMILNLANDPVIERILAPRIGLTIAEYLAFEHNMHILVILTDMTNYADALRSISIAREEVPARKGYPGYLYT